MRQETFLYFYAEYWESFNSQINNSSNYCVMKIYVTDGNNRAALAITRSLGEKGHQIIVGEHKSASLAGSSKYCSQAVSYTDPLKNMDGFVDCIVKQIEEYDIDVIIPVSDITTFLIVENSAIISKHCKIPFGDYLSVQHAADKKRLFELASDLNIPIPRTITIPSLEVFSSTTIDIPFPLVIKPSKSRVRTEDGWIFTSVSYADTPHDLANQLSSKHPQEFPILLQEKITGPGIGIFTCFQHGKPVAMFSHKRLREKPPSGGTSVLRESIAVDPVAAKISTELLKAINWHGVAMVEFKLDDRDQTPKLMEINGRFWGSLQLAIDSGVDFPDLIIKSLDANDFNPVKNYRIGIKSRWLLGDLDVLLLLLLKPRKLLNLPDNYPGKLRCILRFLNFWESNQYFEVLRLRDIKPFFTELKMWLK